MRSVRKCLKCSSTHISPTYISDHRHHVPISIVQLTPLKWYNGPREKEHLLINIYNNISVLIKGAYPFFEELVLTFFLMILNDLKILDVEAYRI